MLRVTYQVDQLLNLTKRPYPKVYLGNGIHSDRWTVVAIEGTASGGPILTLRADGYMGLLPELDESKVPQEIRQRLEALLEKVVASVGRVDPGATVDFCRHALALIFGHLSGVSGLDLVPSVDAGIAAGKFQEGAQSWAARIAARLHTRTKPHEVEERNLRELEDSDARLAVESLAFILKEQGWSANE